MLYFFITSFIIFNKINSAYLNTAGLCLRKSPKLNDLKN